MVAHFHPREGIPTGLFLFLSYLVLFALLGFVIDIVLQVFHCSLGLFAGFKEAEP